jgi:hypothetical protein
VVSHHLDGFLRTTVAGLLHPAADLGVRRVSRPRATQESEQARTRATRTFPATGFTPFEEFPSFAAAPHHCGRCPRAVAGDPPDEAPIRLRGPPRHRPVAGRLQGLPPRTSPLRSGAVASGGSLASPMGLVPPRGPITSRRAPEIRWAALRGAPPGSLPTRRIVSGVPRHPGSGSPRPRRSEGLAPPPSVRRASS